MKGVFLLIEEKRQLDSEAFDKASSKLTSDKNFVLKAMVADCPLFFKASAELQKDFDLAVAALKTKTSVEMCCTHATMMWFSNNKSGFCL